MRVLLIDDEQFYFKLLGKALKAADYDLEYAKSGSEGLARVPSFQPEMLIVDLKLPEMDGFEILLRLRRDPNFGHIPVIVITSKDELSEKLKAFELGADDYVVKPFQPEELVARMGILARRGRAMQIVQQMEKTASKANATVITVHSLRGGLGCSSIVVNLGLAFHKLWGKQTLLIDGILTAGQVALMLDAKPAATWENLVGVDSENLDDAVTSEMMCLHNSGIRYIASPRYPIAADTFTNETLKLFMDTLKSQTDFIVVDISHDFSDMTIQMLSASNAILLVMAPEMASLRTTMSALEIYDRLGIPLEKVKIVLNNNSSNPAIKQAQLEKVLKRPVDFVLPFEAGAVNRALNFGQPFILSNPDLQICQNLEKMAYMLSGNAYTSIPPAVPSPTWKRVTSQLSTK
ncbi:MAG TPA: response regulator [Anaerolineales bacterium]|jgi:pilus assembly protein CpaE|nr:response regulator [Anaerolineales bacterium]